MKLETNVDVKIMLNQHGFTPTTLAMHLRCSIGSLYGIFRGTMPSKKLTAQIEEIFGVEVEKIQAAYKNKFKAA